MHLAGDCRRWLLLEIGKVAAPLHERPEERSVEFYAHSVLVCNAPKPQVALAGWILLPKWYPVTCTPGWEKEGLQEEL